MYTLILITVLNGAVAAENLGEHDSLASCFEGREDVLVDHRAWDGYLEPGKQAICVANPEIG